MIKSNLKPLEEIEKEAREYKPEVGDTVWTFKTKNHLFNTVSMRTVGPVIVSDISDDGVCTLKDPENMVVVEYNQVVAPSRGKAAMLAADYYNRLLLAAKADVARMEYEVEKFCSKEGVL